MLESQRDERGINHREGVEAEPVTQAKLDELPAQHLGHVFERTTVVDHDDLMGGARLSQNAFHRFDHKVFVVVVGDDDRDERLHGALGGSDQG